MDPSLRGWRGGGRWPGGGPGDWPSCLGLAVVRSSSGTLTNCRDLSGLGNVRASNTLHVTRHTSSFTRVVSEINHFEKIQVPLF